MHTEPDVTRIVRSWLNEDDHDSADRVLATVLSELDTTRQRRPWWPAWRYADMNIYAKLATAAAAVLAIAFITVTLLPRDQSGVGGPAGSPTPSPSPAAATASSLPPAPSPAGIFPPLGPLTAGTHQAEVLGVPLTFEVPDGWQRSSLGVPVIERRSPSGDRAWIAFWNPDNVYVWPCAGQPLSPVAGPSAADLAAAMGRLQGTTASPSSDVTVGGLPAMLVGLTVLPALDCSDAPLSYIEDASGLTTKRPTSLPGATVRTWIVEVAGTRILFDSEQSGTDPELTAEIRAIVDSVRFE